MKNITPILKSLGLLDSEVKTYLSALENGPGTVIEISKNTGLSRQACYVAIEELTKRGLMSSVLRGKKKYFAAEHPEKLLTYARGREQDIKEKIKDLERSVAALELQMGGEKPVVKVFEGKEGIRAILEYVSAAHPKEVFEMTDVEAMYMTLKPEDLQPYRKTAQKAQKHVMGLYYGKLGPKIVDADRRSLPKEEGDFKSNITVYQDSIALVTFEGKMHSVIIESKPLAKALRILFGRALKGSQDLPSA